MCELQSHDTKSLVRSIWEQPGKHGKLNSVVTVVLKCVFLQPGHGWVWLKTLRDQTFLRNFSQRSSSLKTCDISVTTNRVREMPAYQNFKCFLCSYTSLSNQLWISGLIRFNGTPRLCLWCQHFSLVCSWAADSLSLLSQLETPSPWLSDPHLPLTAAETELCPAGLFWALSREVCHSAPHQHKPFVVK